MAAQSIRDYTLWNESYKLKKQKDKEWGIQTS